jgi:hypothetical protein|tara:strand:+ start:1196 stop:1324 length:129 start_codon:yes stop_codon:yes gene_type:complete
MLEEAIAKFFDNCDTDYLQSVNDEVSTFEEDYENSYIEEGLE